MESNGPKTSAKKVGRPKKSESTSKRQINVYLPSMVMVEEWRTLALESGVSLSRWVQEHIESSLQQNGEGPRYSRRDLIDRNLVLEEENQKLHQEMAIKSKAYEALDRELQQLRTKPFLDSVYQGYRLLKRELVKTFRERKKISYDELLPVLHVNPRDMDSIKAVNAQIDILLDLGIIEQDLRGWRWIS